MARQHESKYKFTYRRTNKLSPDTIRKLEEAAGVRLNITESCAYAGIHRDTYYDWMKKVTGLSDKLEDLRANPLIRAKRRIVSQLDIDTGTAFKYLEKENPDEYSEFLRIKHSGEIANSDTHPEDEELRLLFKSKLQDNIRRRAIEKAKAQGKFFTKEKSIQTHP